LEIESSAGKTRIPFGARVTGPSPWPAFSTVTLYGAGGMIAGVTVRSWPLWFASGEPFFANTGPFINNWLPFNAPLQWRQPRRCWVRDSVRVPDARRRRSRNTPLLRAGPELGDFSPFCWASARASAAAKFSSRAMGFLRSLTGQIVPTWAPGRLDDRRRSSGFNSGRGSTFQRLVFARLFGVLFGSSRLRCWWGMVFIGLGIR
jgi:hypothetical protein